MQTFNPKIGFKLQNKKEALLWWKYKAWKQGIGPNEFRKCTMRDLQDIMEIESVIAERELREKEINNIKAEMGLR